MNPQRLPKICLTRLMHFHRSSNAAPEYNWVAQINIFLQKVNMSNLLESASAEDWKSMRILAFTRFDRHLKFQDILAHSDMSHMNCPIPRSLDYGTADYILCENNFSFVKTLAQARLSTRYSLRFCIKGLIYKINQHEQCMTCNMHALETLQHILVDCPTYEAVRDHYLRFLLNVASSINANPLVILNCSDTFSIRMIYFYIVNCLRLRSSLLNE